MHHLLHLEPDDLVHRQCEFDGDEADVGVGVEEAGGDELVEDEVPVPRLGVDAVLLDQQLHQLEPGQHDAPLLLVRPRPTLVHKVHDAVHQLLDVHGWVPEEADQRVQGVVTGAEVQLLDLVY